MINKLQFLKHFDSTIELPAGTRPVNQAE